MKFSEAVLYPNEQVSKNVLDYAAAHTTSLPKHLLDYHAEIVATQERSEYMISTFQAAAMTQIARIIGAKRVLEIGVYVGFSAMSWAHAVGPDGSITGLESVPKYAEFAQNSCKKYNVENVEIITGDAAETLKTLAPEQPYDLIFIDANKTGYPDYLKQILSKSKPNSTSRLLRPGGLILADNVLRRGLAADDSDANPHAANERTMRSEYSKSTDLEKLREYNDMCVSDPRLESWLVPLWDGINVTRLVD